MTQVPGFRENRFGYTIEETCEVTTLSRTKLYELMDQGKLRFARVGTRRVITPEAIRDMLAGLEVA